MSAPEPRPNFLDRAILAISPERGERRIRARQRALLSYEAARPSRTRGAMAPNVGPNSYRLAYDRVQLMDEARRLERDFPLIYAILDLYGEYVLPQIRWQAQTGDAALDAAIEDYWERWTESVDVAGELSLVEAARLALRSRKRDGDMAVVKSIDGDRPAVQLVESDRVGGGKMAGISGDNIEGVTYDPETGKRLAYTIFRRTSGDSYVDPVEIEARHVLFQIAPTRAGQVRGYSELAAIINTCRDYKETMESLRAGIKLEALHSGVIYQDRPDADPSALYAMGSTEQIGSSEQPVEEISAGRLLRLRAHEKVDFLANSRPSTAFQGYMDSLIAEISLGIGLPTAFVYGLLNGRGPGVRADLLRAERRIELEQDLLVRQLLAPLQQWVVEWGVLTEQLPADALRRLRGRWLFGRRLSIDAGYDSKATIEEYRTGLKTLAQIYDEQGKDWESEVAQQVREQARLRELGVAVGVDVLDQRSLTPSGQVPTPVAPPPQPASDPATLAAEDSYTPPQAVADAAQRALDVRSEKPESQRGMTPVGVARARDLSNRRPVSVDTLRRMASYFARHAVDKDGSTWSEQGPGWQAWHGWGGDAGRDWADRILREIDGD
jgi:capsid protein